MVNCFVCKKENAQPCGSCRLTHYCGAKCYNKNWPEHKIICTTPLPNILRQNYQLFKTFKPGMVFAIMDENGKEPLSANVDLTKTKFLIGTADDKNIRNFTIQFKEFGIVIPNIQDQLEGDENLDMVIRLAKTRGVFENMEKDRLFFWVRVEEQPQSDAKVSEVVEPKRTFVQLSDPTGQMLCGPLSKVKEEVPADFKKALESLKDYNTDNAIYIMHANDKDKIVLTKALRSYVNYLTE